MTGRASLELPQASKPSARSAGERETREPPACSILLRKTEARWRTSFSLPEKRIVPIPVAWITARTWTKVFAIVVRFMRAGKKSAGHADTFKTAENFSPKTLEWRCCLACQIVSSDGENVSGAA